MVDSKWATLTLTTSVNISASIISVILVHCGTTVSILRSLSLTTEFHHAIAETMWRDKQFMFLIAYIGTNSRCLIFRIFSIIWYPDIEFHLFILRILFAVRKMEEKETKPISLTKTDHSTARIITGSVHLEYDPTEK